MSPEEEDKTRDVASVRIHVESAIKRVKNYNILTQIIPNSMAEDSVSGVFFLFPKTRNLKIYGFKKFSKIDLKPTNGYRVCGQHFEGGKKTY